MNNNFQSTDKSLRFDISKLITVLFSSTLFLRNVGGAFHLINIGIPIILALLLSLVYGIYTKKILEAPSLIILHFLFILYLYIGIYYSNAPNYGKDKIFGLFLQILLAIFSGKYIIENFDFFLKSNLIFFIIFIVAYFSHFGNFGNILNMLTPQKRLEMGGEVFKAISTSRYIGFNLISMFFFFYKKKKNLTKKIIFPLLFVSGLFMMALFGSKGPILSLLLAPLIYTSFYKRNNLKKTIILTLALIGISTILIYPELILKLVPQQYEGYFYARFFNYESYADRTSLVKMAISDIEQRSLIFGKGTGNYGFLYTKRDLSVYPHNIFIEILYENGIIGVALFIWILLSCLLTKIHRKIQNSQISFFLILTYYYLLGAQVSGDISNNYPLFIFIIFMYFQRKQEFRLATILKIINRDKNKTEIVSTYYPRKY